MVELVSDRTFFIDRCVGRVAGLARLVILGSGLDTRAYRLACLPKNCHVYEVCKQAVRLLAKLHAMTLGWLIMPLPHAPVAVPLSKRLTRRR